MDRRLGVLAVVVVLVVASVVMLAVPSAPPAPVGSPAASAPSVKASAVTPTFYYNYSDFFNVPYGEWWDIRAPLYGDEPVGADCFNATTANDGTCTTRVSGLPVVEKYPYMDWAGSGVAANEGSATSIYAPYRAAINGLYVPGYNLSQPVFLPVLNYAAAPGNLLSFNWNMQYLTQAQYTALTSSPLSCYSASAALSNDGYQLKNRIYLTLDNQEAARLFGAQISTSLSTMQGWWNTNTLPGCSGSHSQSGPLESSLNTWFANEANGKYDIYNGYAAGYTSLYTNITATVLSPGATGTTQVYIEHGAWGTEILLDRWFYWGNATYAGNQADSSKAKGWWGMENGWWEGLHYAGKLQATTMNFNLTGVLQYHFQEHSSAGPDGLWHTADDTPYWTWGPMLVDYVFSSGKGPYSELNRYSGLNYIKTTPGSGDYGTNTSFDYTPISWAAPAQEQWNFVFPTNTSAYYQNPATSPLGTDPLLSSQLPNITSTLSLMKIFPAGYGSWDAGTGTWTVNGGTAESWPASTGPGTYPYIPYPGIYLQPSNFPPSVTTNAATSITTTTATLNGNLASLGSASSATVGFLWGTSPTLASPANVSVGTHAVGAFSTSLASLTPGTVYYFEAWADSTAGFSTGGIQSFTAGVYPPAVTTVAASGITASGATLNGNLNDLGSATTVTVGFLWGTDPALATSTNVTVGPETATGPFSHALVGLAQGTTYYFKAWANGARYVEDGILGFTTTAPPLVTTVAASGVTASAATLNGDLTDMGTTAYVTVGFWWGTSPSLASPTNVTVGPMTLAGTFNSVLNSLAAGTTYYFEAWANGIGFATGGILNFQTPAPPTVATDAASGITTTAATINGHTTALGTATTVTVGFLWGTASNLASATNVTVGPQTAAAAFSTALSGLTAGTTYYFRAWANGDGFVQGSILQFVAGVSPPSVTTVAASAVTATGATLNGNLAGLGTATTVTVGFLWGTSATLASPTNVTVGPETATGAFTQALTGLTQGTTYYFAAWANGQGFVQGTILSFATSTSAAAPSVTTVAATSITTTGATLNGNVGGLGSASSVTVGFLWGTDSALAGATNVTVGPQTATGAFTSALTGLTPGTTYYFEAWTNGAGFAHGTILSFTALASTGPSEPTFLGLPAALGYGLLAAIIIVIVAVIVVVLLMRRRPKSPPPETP